MKAVIMAGGEGTRLRPLTCDLPKPMVRLCGRPVLEYSLDLLGQYGVTEAWLTVRYLAREISSYFPSGEYGGIRLHFSMEEHPLGTAGSVKNAWDATEDFVVISGDALCDFDLKKAMEEHRRGGYDASILVKRVDDPREYGLVRFDETGRVLSFLEKPGYSQAATDCANTGIYLLSPQAMALVPQGKPFDFAKDLFPLMLKNSMKIGALEQEGYWCDIGDLESYRRCQADILHGRVRLPREFYRDAMGNIVQGMAPSGGQVRLIAPVYLGPDVHFEGGVTLGPDCVLEEGCTVLEGARIRESIVLRDSLIGRDAALTGTIVGSGGSVKDFAMLFEGSVLGSGAVLGSGSCLNPGVRIWPYKTSRDGGIIKEDIRRGAGVCGYFCDGSISGQVGVELTPEFCARLGAACGSVEESWKIGAGCEESSWARAMKNAFLAGVQSAGASALDFGENFLAQFGYCMNFCALHLGVFFSGETQGHIRVFTDGGLPATRELERKIEGSLLRGEASRCGVERFGSCAKMDGMRLLYVGELLKQAPLGLSGMQVQVSSDNEALRSVLTEVLARLGCVSGDTGVHLEFSGEDSVRLTAPEGVALDAGDLLILCALLEFEQGRDVSVPYDSPWILEEMASARGRSVYRYFACPAGDSDATARKKAHNALWSRDMLMVCLRLLGWMQENHLSAAQLAKRLPGYRRVQREIPLPVPPARLLSRLSRQEGSESGDGVRLHRELGTILVRPVGRGTTARILAEAKTAEIAAELCADVTKLIEESQED